METGITKNQIIEVLARSPHGKLSEYIPVGRAATKQDAEFAARLIAWNEKNGQIRDSKVALPIITLTEPTFNGELAENSYAHLALLDPRNLVRAWRFAREIKPTGHGHKLNALIERYLRFRESIPGFWERTAIAHRDSMKSLYALAHVKPVEFADKMLFKGRFTQTSLFGAVAGLKNMTPQEAAGTILQRRIPFLVAIGALGAKAKDAALVLALIERMSATELVTNTKMLERLGVKENPALRSAFEAGLKKIAASKKVTLKTTRAAEQMTDTGLKEKLRGAQEKQLKTLGGIEGDWLVLGDKSGSMTAAIETAKLVAATLAKMVKGKVHLVFFDTSPRYIEATGRDYDALLFETRNVRANGGTSIGCGLQYALERKLPLNGIAIVSDGGENNSPVFSQVYPEYCKRMDCEPAVYFYRTQGDQNTFSKTMSRAQLDLQEFDLTAGVDFYSLPNLVATMNTRRYGLIDSIMETPLLTLDEVFKYRKGEAHA